MEQTALDIIDKLNTNGYSAYIVGGAVRDKLLNLKVEDYDITTNATPPQIKSLFKDYKLIESGIKHGTIGVYICGKVYEITTFRKEENYINHRSPACVSFDCDLQEDLKRRDFTINALAYNPKTGIIDYFNGIDDLNNKVIRTVGDPFKRFEEDALRILRAIRFASKFGFKIDNETYIAMLKCKGYLKFISKERIFAEMTKIVCGNFVAEAISSCKQIIFEIIPELYKCDGFNQFSLSHDYDVFNHTMRAMKICKVKKPNLMWALLLHDIGKPFCFKMDKNGYGHTYGHMEVSANISKDILSRLKFPKKLANEVLVLIANHDRDIGSSKYNVKKFISQYGYDLTEDLLTLKMADGYAHSTYGYKKYSASKFGLRDYLEEIITNNEVCEISKLKVSGDDLISIGITGKDIKIVKELLFDNLLKSNVENNKNQLLQLAKKLYKNIKN